MAPGRPPGRGLRPTDAIYHFDKADVIVSLDADFLACGRGSVRYQQDFAARRRVTDDAQGDEPALRDREHADADRREGGSSAGAEGVRDRRLCAPARPGALGARRDRPSSRIVPTPISATRTRRSGCGRRQGSAGAPRQLAGRRRRDYQPAAVHALAHAMNQALGNVGTTVTYGAPIEAIAGRPGRVARELVRAMDAGQVELLVILGGESRLHRAGGPQVRREARQGRPGGLSRTLRRRDGEPLPLEPRRGAPARELGRRARVRRHRHDHAAADRAALRGPIGARSARRRSPPQPDRRGYADRQGLLDARVRRGSGWTHPRRRRAAVQERRHVLEPCPARRVHRRHRDRRRRTRRRRSSRRRAGAVAATRPRRAAGGPGRRPRSGCAAAALRRRRSPPAAPASASAPAGAGRARDHLPARSDDLGRPLREQRLAAGAAQAADEDHVGPDGVDQPAARQGARPAATATSSSCAIAATPRACPSSGSPVIPRSPSRCSSATAAAWPAASAPRRRMPRSSTPISCAPPTRRGSAAASRSRRPATATCSRRRRNTT